MKAAKRALAASVCLLTACASNTAPLGFFVSPEREQSQAYGGWIQLELANRTRVDGELIAATAESVWVLPSAPMVRGKVARDTTVLVLAVATIEEGFVTISDAEVGGVVGATASGVLSTISNGLVAVLTAPLWIIVGTAAGSSQSYTPRRTVPPLHWADLAPYARFPQGMPAGVSLASLRPKRRR